MQLKRVGRAWVAVSTFEERLIPKVAGFRWSLPSPRSTLMAPVPVAEGTLKE